MYFEAMQAQGFSWPRTRTAHEAQAAPPAPSPRPTGTPAYVYVCNTCRGEDVKSDAWAQWDVSAQVWVLDTTFDESLYCESCEGECTVRAQPIAAAPPHLVAK